MPYEIHQNVCCRSCGMSGVSFRMRFNKTNNKYYRQPDCAQCEKAALYAWREANPESFRKHLMDAYWRKVGRGRKIRSSSEMTDEVRREWLREKAHTRMTRAKKARVQWDVDLTDLVFKEARDLCKRFLTTTGQQYHIDHVLPLRGKNVSGLHVWNNLRVIPKELNLRKGNKEMTKFHT